MRAEANNDTEMASDGEILSSTGTNSLRVLAKSAERQGIGYSYGKCVVYSSMRGHCKGLTTQGCVKSGWYKGRYVNHHDYVLKLH